MATDLGSDELSDTADGAHNRLKKLGKYRIERRIGAGGMGTVFLAVDTDLNRTVALKVLPKDRAENPVLVRRFKAEGQAAAHMEHPNIVRVFEAGEADGFLYMALEYIEGVDVYELVERRGVIPVKRSTDIIRQTVLALQHAHQKGIVHRDIKPSNLLIKRDGSVKLADMGLARSVDETLETNITRAGTTVGTVDYMSPEQARNSKAADVRSDIYSLGCTWFHMLTGHPPFCEGAMTAKLQAHAVSPRPDPRAENPNVPEGIVAIIQRMMAIKPDDRYQTPQELLDDLATTDRMHRNVDESAIAALADEGDDPEVVDNDVEPVLRVGDIDDLDLAALRESGEYDVEETSTSNPIKPRAQPGKQPSKKKSKQRKQKRSAATAETTDVEAPPPQPSERAFPPIEPEEPSRQQAAAPRSPLPDEEPEPVSRKKKSNKAAATETPKTAPDRPAKRGSVRTSAGKTPTLPGKEASSSPVDASAGAGFDPDTLKFLIPAALVVAAIAGIGYALMRGGDTQGVPAVNPYDDGQSEVDGAPSASTPVVKATGPAPDRQDDSPPAEASPAVVSSDFPGAEDAPAVAANRQPLIPDWVEAFRHPLGQAERSLVVRRRPDGGGQVATIAEALRKLPSGGGTIEIDGDGPFSLEPVDIANRQRVRIQAAQGRRPVIHLQPGEDWTSGPLVEIRQTHAEFAGLHFVLVDAGPADGVLFEVEHGDVSFRNCSITVDRQAAEAHLTAVHLDGGVARRGAAASGKCLLENVVIRGDNLTAIALAGTIADVVVGNCLLASGGAPAIVVDDTGGRSAATASGEPARTLRLLATTIVAGSTGLALHHQGAGSAVVPTDIIMRQSLLASQSGADPDAPTSMAALVGWPVGDGGLGTSHLKDLTWQASQTTFVGWSHLLTMADADDTPQERIAATTDDWRKFWNQGLRSDAIVPEPLPPVGQNLVTPQMVHANLSANVAPVKGGQLPGCRPSDFPSLPNGLIAHVAAAVRRPYEPASLGSGMTIEGEPIRFDLGLRRNLSRFLASDACKDGTHVIAFGSGLKELDPVVIENKSLRLEFEHTDKSPLVIQPSAGREGAPQEEALFTVRNGTLDLVGAPLKIPARRTRAFPKSAILLENASLSVRHSTIEGPRVAVDDDASPLIRTAGEASEETPQHVFLESSFFVNLGPLISGPIRWQTLTARNCVLVSLSDAIVVTAETQPATLVVDHCTISTSGAAIRADLPSVSAANGLTLFARACVFAGPIDGNRETSAVVAHSAGAAQEQSLVWWGSANGYSTRLTGSIVDGPGQPGDFPNDWLRAWGDGHEANPLTGKADVLFLKPLPDIRVVEPQNFALSDSATAATWGPQNSPIGAEVDTVGPESSEAMIKERSQGGSPIKSVPARPGRTDPGF